MRVFEIICPCAKSLNNNIRPSKMARGSYCFHFTESETEDLKSKLTCSDNWAGRDRASIQVQFVSLLGTLLCI